MNDAGGNRGYSGSVSRKYKEDEVNTIVSASEKLEYLSQKRSEDIDNLKKVKKT